MRGDSDKRRSCGKVYGMTSTPSRGYGGALGLSWVAWLTFAAVCAVLSVASAVAGAAPLMWAFALAVPACLAAMIWRSGLSVSIDRSGEQDRRPWGKA